MLYTAICALRRFFRRYSWHLLTPLFILAYPAGWYGLLKLQALGLTGNDLHDAIAQAAGKTVDPLLLLTKLGVSVAVFAFVNLLGYAALGVVPVAPDWAKGLYKEREHYEAVGLEGPVRGFKYTFLTLSPLARIVLYVGLWALELLVAAGSLYTGFQIQ